jgi:hypothetical protein
MRSVVCGALLAALVFGEKPDLTKKVCYYQAL